LKVGFGSFSYFGLAENYGDNWVGRYYVQQAAILGMSLMPAASFKVTDWLSVGGGPNVMFGYLKDKTAINNQTPGVPDGQLYLQDQAWGVGGNAGILVQPHEGTRLGITYLSPVKLDFSATPTIGGVVPSIGSALTGRSQLNMGVTVPQTVMIGIYQELNAKWAVMADVGWQNWHEFGQITASVDTPGGAQTATITTSRLNYQDTWHGAVGAQYRYSEQWRFSGGVAFDSSAEKSADRSVVLPMGQAWRFGLGAEWQATEKLSLGAGYEFTWMGNMSVDQGTDGTTRGRVQGSYESAWISFFTLNLAYKF
jgi:long-chain fatty acid transport protein